MSKPWSPMVSIQGSEDNAAATMKWLAWIASAGSAYLRCCQLPVLGCALSALLAEECLNVSFVPGHLGLQVLQGPCKSAATAETSLLEVSTISTGHRFQQDHQTALTL